MRLTVLLTTIVLLVGCNNSDKGAQHVFNGGDSSGGGVFTYKQPAPNIASEKDIQESVENQAQVLAWKFFVSATSDLNFPHRARVLEKLNELKKYILKKDSIQFLSNQPSQPFKPYCKTNKGEARDASIYPDDGKSLICMSLALLEAKQILKSDLEAEVASYYIHEVSHLAEFKTEAEAVAFEQYFKLYFNDYKSSDLLSGNFIYTHRLITRLTAYINGTKAANQTYEMMYVCSQLELIYVESSKLGGALFSAPEKAFLKSLQLKSKFDFLLRCNKDFQKFMDEVVMDMTTFNFKNIMLRFKDDIENFKSQPLNEENLPVTYSVFSGLDFSTLNQSSQFMDRIMYYLQTLEGCENTVYGSVYGFPSSKCDNYPYVTNTSVDEKLFSLFPDLKL